jgi:hypothetical protein
MLNVSPSFKKKIEQVRAQRIAAGLLEPDTPSKPKQMLSVLIDMRPAREKAENQPRKAVSKSGWVGLPSFNQKPPELSDGDELKSIPTVREIVSVCASVYGVSYLDIVSARRTLDVIWPRQVAMYLSKEMTPRSLPEIGRVIGNRDHTTVLHGVRKITALIGSDLKLRASVDKARLRLLPVSHCYWGA